jgi:hypothetical protein
LELVLKGLNEKKLKPTIPQGFERVRDNLLKQNFPILMKAIGEAVRLNEPLEPTTPRINEAMILEEISETKASSQDIPHKLFPKTLKVIRQNHQSDPLDLLLYDGVMHRGFQKMTYKEVTQELNKNKGLCKIMGCKITEPLVRGRLNRMELPSKQLNAK